MAKIYETDRTHMNIPLSNGMIEFTPERDPVVDRIFGTFNSGAKHIQDRCRVEIEDPKNPKNTITRAMTAEELEEAVEGLPEWALYQSQKKAAAENKTALEYGGPSGVKGVWPKSDRLDQLKLRVGSRDAAPSNPYAALPEDDLRALIAAKGAIFPPDAKKEELLKILAQAQNA